MLRTNNIQNCKIAGFICEDVEIENEAGTNKFCSWDGKLLNFGLAFLKETREWMKYDILAYRSETSKAFNLSSALFKPLSFGQSPFSVARTCIDKDVGVNARLKLGNTRSKGVPRSWDNDFHFSRSLP